MQVTKGSPVNPALHVQIGLWFMTWQRALIPHVPGHGSLHFWCIQAWCWGQSVLTTHSGLHVGGVPTNPSWQEHTPWPSTSLQLLYGPQGEGTHGFVSSIGAKRIKCEKS